MNLYPVNVVQFAVIYPVWPWNTVFARRREKGTDERYNYQSPDPCTCSDRRFVGHLISEVS